MSTPSENSDGAATPVLVIHPGSLGDMLLSVPALRAIRHHFGPGELVLLAKQEVAELLALCGEVDCAVSIEGPTLSCLLSGGGALPVRVQQWFDRRPSVVAWMADSNGRLENTLRQSGCRRVIVRSPMDEAIRATHQADRFLETLGIERGSPTVTPTLNLPPEIRQQGIDLLVETVENSSHPTVFAHAGSGSRFKCVAPVVLARVCEALSVDETTVILVEGPADAEVTAEVHRLCPRVAVLRELPLGTLASVLAQADLFVGHDSGLSHLAAALGVPTVAIFGPTDPARWAPLGRHVTVIRGGPCHCATWAMVTRCSGRPCLEVRGDQLAQRCRSAMAHSREQPCS
jgi:ADP-heptose:LPS heptosyltransferase